MIGVVAKSTGKLYKVWLENNLDVDASLKGGLRLLDIKSTNPVAVGDTVEVEISSTGEYLISKIHERTNYIIRKSINLSKQTHIIASNIDLAILVVSLVAPRTSAGFIDRFLVTAEAYHIPVLLVFNKIDLYGEDENAKNFIDAYAQLGYDIVRTSVISIEGIDKLKTHLKSGNILFSGHSGVGKSTLLNLIDSSLELKTGEISLAHLKGKHTTTFAEMFKTTLGARLIDTPGIKELGLVDIERNELRNYFPEFKDLNPRCKFNNCIHVNEPGCAVQSAVEGDPEKYFRYLSYLKMLEECI
jgi:ribosome biogenesis GTPase